MDCKLKYNPVGMRNRLESADDDRKLIHFLSSCSDSGPDSDSLVSSLSGVCLPLKIPASVEEPEFKGVKSKWRLDSIFKTMSLKADSFSLHLSQGFSHAPGCLPGNCISDCRTKYGLISCTAVAAYHGYRRRSLVNRCANDTINFIE